MLRGCRVPVARAGIRDRPRRERDLATELVPDRQDMRFAPHGRGCTPTLGPVSRNPEQAWLTGAVMSASPGRRVPDHRRPTSLLEQVGLARRLSGGRWLLIGELAKFVVVGVLAVLIAGVGTNVLHFQAGVGPLT